MNLDKGKVVEATRRLPVEDFDEFLKRVVGMLRNSVERYSWVGVYMVENDHLVLKAFSGEQETEHIRIRLGEGICGLAAETGRTIVVPDVSREPKYIACFTSTKSEIVVPIKVEGKIVGEIDIDSDFPDAFTREDEELLEEVAEMISEKLAEKPE
ncbi:MAG: GAF domain-containing protein [Thermoproteota archaeon]